MTSEVTTIKESEVELSKADLPRLLTFLQEHSLRTHDIVAPAQALIYSAEGTLLLR